MGKRKPLPSKTGSSDTGGVAKQGIGDRAYTPPQKLTTGKYGHSRPAPTGKPGSHS